MPILIHPYSQMVITFTSSSVMLRTIYLLTSALIQISGTPIKCVITNPF